MLIFLLTAVVARAEMFYGNVDYLSDVPRKQKQEESKGCGSVATEEGEEVSEGSK